MDSARKNMSKKAALITSKYDIFDKNLLPNSYFQLLQKTKQKKSIGKENVGIPQQLVQDEDELSILQRKVNKLVNQCRQLDEQILKNDQLQHQKCNEDIFKTENQQLDNYINILADRNQLLNILQSNFNANNTGIQILEGDYLITYFSKQNQVDQQFLQKQEQEYDELQKVEKNMQQELYQLDTELLESQKQNSMSNLQQFILQKKQKQKQFSVQIIQEQYYCYKKKTRTFCIFHSKKLEYDQTYQPFVKIKNQKQLFFENNEALNSNIENTSVNLWSSSKQKLKKINPYRCQYYKFDQIFQRKENNAKASQYESFFHSIELYIKGTLYKQIDLILKTYSFNSQEYQLLYDQDLHENIEKLRKICDKEKLDSYNKLIVFLSDKNRGLVGNLIRFLATSLNHFNNQIVEVNDLTLTLTKFQIKEPQCEDILECKVQNIEMMIDCLQRKDIFTNAQFHLRIDIFINTNLKRTLHILMLAPLLIENNELFCKQFKSVFKREKAFKEQLGSKVESIVKTCDKLMIITQIPEMVKLNGNQQKKISLVQNIVNFQSLLVVKQEQ